MMEKFLLPETRNLVVAGTHGKTTTSSMLAHTLTVCGRDPSYFIGGVSQDLPTSFQVSKKNEFFVLEGDEYDTAFWDKVPKFNHYLPDDVILTSVEYDHADIYPSFEAVIDAFKGLVSRIRTGGRLIACTDYPVMPMVLKDAKVPVIPYGSHAVSGARFTPSNIQMNGAETSFEIRDGDKTVDKIVMHVPGKHNVLNALSVWIVCRELGIAPELIRKGLASFKGVIRRQEERGEVRGVLVIDDFAHHPTAVRETLIALKGKYPGRKLVTVFEPRSATSRRKVFQKDFAKAFAEADELYIAQPYDQSKIPEDDRFSSDQLVKDVIQKGKSAHIILSADDGVAKIAHAAKKGDVIAVLSNGGFDGFIPKLLEKLKQS
jgi:UDP-N-acetylmuramate: L-alanyl-gamma-D-glutamyl-meso-diaminopimelate ligase